MGRVIPSSISRILAARPGRLETAVGSGGVRRLIWSYAIGALGYATGLLASTLYDLPTGAVIVWTPSVTGILAGMLLRWQSPERSA